MLSKFSLCALFSLAAVVRVLAQTGPVLSDRPAAGDFTLVEAGRSTGLLVDETDFEVVRVAAECFATDVERVTGVKPAVGSQAVELPGQAVIVGTVGRSALIDKLVRDGKLDVAGIAGKWECFVLATVDDPLPGMKRALVVAGSDRRGTAYGVFELSAAIGVSPWVWWADVPPAHRDVLAFKALGHRSQPPSVKYRGIFINDEDWGLQPWAAKTFEPETKDIGPKTYAKVCELLLRLKANYLWPAMHDCTRAFNHYPENKVVADRYAIVMGSSHAEPMLRNNVDEWPKDRHEDWNPVTKLPGILEYWEQRVRENGRYENVYTVGMRGIHDSSMPGGGTIVEKRERLEKIVGLQRDMLARHVNADPARVPQIFVPYKEVLEIYQSGMQLPDDITLVWPDDNFGYVRQLPNARERARAGGNGVYYHLSYWGRPHDYLWLDSTAPALVWNEMTRAYEAGARQLWVVNVGDIKSIESGMTLFLEMAWDIGRYGPDVQQTFLRHFAAQQFGEAHADEIAALRDEYFRLCAIRRPEHMGFNRTYFSRTVPNNPVQDSDWSADEEQQLMDRWLALGRRAAELGPKLPPEARDAYFQLVEYPAVAGAAMAEKILAAEKARLTGSAGFARQSEAALRRIEQLTERYNTLEGGKWRGVMDHRPRRLPVFDQPSTTLETNPAPRTTPPEGENVVVIDPAKFTKIQDRAGAGWRVLEGLGPRGRALAVLPHGDLPTLRSAAEIRERAPVADYAVGAGAAGEGEVRLEALPTRPLTPEHAVVAAVSIDEGEPVLVRFENGRDDEKDPVWQTNVLRSAMSGKATLPLPAGACTLKLWAADGSVVVQRITLARAAARRVVLRGDAGGKRFDGIGVVNGGGATSVLLKDYPEPQRSQILDLLYKPHFGASVSTLLVEIPGDGNSTQGSMPSHMHTREDLDYHRGYTWWILREAKNRNPKLSLDGAAWSAPGWVGNGDFWSQDAADYLVKWLEGLRDVHGLRLDAIGCRNEKGVSFPFAKTLRRTLNAKGFADVKLHAFDHWPDDKLDFVKKLADDPEARDAIDIFGAHVFYANRHASAEVQALAEKMGKPIWNTEDHVYKKGFDCLISLVECFNDNFIKSGATKVVNWYDIAGVYPTEPYPEDPATVLAWWPWSGHYQVRDALWGYAHYGQFTEAGWHYLKDGCGELDGGGSFVTLQSPGDDYSVIIETKGAKAPRQLRFEVGGGLSTKDLCVWRSNAREQFVRQADIALVDGAFAIALEPDSIYSLSTTRGQQKGGFADIPEAKPFPFPYLETFEQYADAKAWGHLPRYFADIVDAFELVRRPDGKGMCIRQAVPAPTISWAPDWLPYTVLGDEHWQDYEVSADVYLNPGDQAGVMGRINHVGTGYGFIPKGYFFQVGDDGQGRLVVVRGKKDKKKAVGDAEQQRLIAAQKDEGEGGEKVLASAMLPQIRANQWHRVTLRFEGTTITALVDGKAVLTATDALYERGMAGLLAGGGKARLSQPFFDDVSINQAGASVPAPSSPLPGQTPLYPSAGRSAR